MKVGDKVLILQEDYRNETGTIVPPGPFQFEGELTVDLDDVEGKQGLQYFSPAEMQLLPPVSPELKQTNPKDAVGSDKLPLHLWPATATAYGCLGLLDGMLKYGRSNWRVAGVRLSIYVDAIQRHTNALFEGEWLDPDSGVPHVSHILACAAIIADAEAAGKLEHDEQFPGGYRELVSDLTPHVKRLKNKHADKSPKHYSVVDA